MISCRNIWIPIFISTLRVSFTFIFNYSAYKLKFQFTTKMYTWCKHVLFPFDSGWPPIGARIKSTWPFRVCCQQLHLPSGQGMWHQSLNFQPIRDTAGFFKTELLWTPVPFTHSGPSSRNLLHPSVQVRFRYHIWHGASLCFSRDHIVWGLPNSFESFFKLGNTFYLALYPQCLA